MFMWYVPIVGAFWRITLIAGIDISAAFIISEEEFLLKPSFIRFLFVRLWIGTPNDYLTLLKPFNVLKLSSRPDI